VITRRRHERQRRLLRAGALNPAPAAPVRPQRRHRTGLKPSCDYVVRPARLEDYDRLNAVFQEGDRLHRSALPDVFRAPDGPARAIDHLADMLSSENSALFVAEVKGKVIGAVSVQIHEAPAIPVLVPRRFAAVSDVVVTRGFRRQGVGRALMEKAQGWARERSVGQAELTVYEFNQDALGFYRRLGYRVVSRRLRKSLSQP
jgi:ribosomal protein S18 acetylase RimI-like enzyme